MTADVPASLWLCPKCSGEPVAGYMTYIAGYNTLLTWRCSAGHEWTLQNVWKYEGEGR